MATTVPKAKDAVQQGNAHALPAARALEVQSELHAAPGYQHLVTLAQLMGRRAAAAAIRTGGTPALSSKSKD
jgi:hypothetical protein